MEFPGLTPNKATLPLVLKVCAKLNTIETRMRIHLSIQNAYLIEDIRVGTAIIVFIVSVVFLKTRVRCSKEWVRGIWSHGMNDVGLCRVWRI